MKPPVDSSRSVSRIAAAWVARRDGGLTQDEERELAAWRAADSEHEDAWQRYETLWLASARPRQTGSAVALERRIVALRAQRKQRRTAAFMAVLVLGVACAWWAQRPASRPMVPTSQSTAMLLLPRQQALPDGTSVEFPEGTEFRVEFSDGQRRLTLLRGEAHFAVVKDPHRPFIVAAAGVEFRAVGTAFSVQLQADAAQLIVTEGRVAVARDGAPVVLVGEAPAQEPSVVEAGRRAVVTYDAEPTDAVKVASVSGQEIGEQLAWRNPRVEFSGAPLGEVVALINQRNRVQLILSEPDLALIELSGVFRADDSESLVRALETGFGLRAEQRGDKVLLSAATAGLK